MSKKPKWRKKFNKINSTPFSEQAKWWLNGTWNDGDDEKTDYQSSSEYAEKVWEYVHLFIETHTGQKVLYGRKKQKEFDEGCDLEEDKAHVILEKLGETMTVLQMRAKFKELDIDKNHKISLIEFLISKYGHTPAEVNEFKQGGVDPKILNAAQEKMDAAQEAMDTAVEDKKKSHDAAVASKKAAEDAKVAVTLSEEKKVEAEKAVVEATKAEEDAAAAKAELQAAVDALEAKELELKTKIDKLEAKSKDGALSTVKRHSAFNKLEQLKSEDPMPLRKAKITQKAALKRMKKTKKQATKTKKASKAAEVAAGEAAEAAKTAKVEADDRAVKAEEAKVEAAEALVAAEEAFTIVEAELEEIKSKGTEAPQGSVWWMERTVKEKKKFMPKKGRNLIG